MSNSTATPAPVKLTPRIHRGLGGWVVRFGRLDADAATWRPWQRFDSFAEARAFAIGSLVQTAEAPEPEPRPEPEPEPELAPRTTPSQPRRERERRPFGEGIELDEPAPSQPAPKARRRRVKATAGA